MISSRGIHKASEQTLLNGRGIIVTEKDKTKYNWDEIPAGSKFIDETTGFEKVKVKEALVDKNTKKPIGIGVIKDGKAYAVDRVTPMRKSNGAQYTSEEVEFADPKDWVPTSRKYSGTLCITKDIMIVKESFVVRQIDTVNGIITYENGQGRQVNMPIQKDGSYVFELEKGSYVLGRTHIEILLNGTQHLNVQNGGITELSSKRFAVKKPLSVGQVVTATYVFIINLGNPYPRIFLTSIRPDEAEVGDLWVDTADFINTDLGVSIDKTLMTDEVLDGGFQSAENNTPPNDGE